MSSSNRDTARYLYAVLPNPEGERLPDRLDGETYLIKGRHFAAVVKNAAISSPVTGDRQELARMLLAHQQVIERVMAWTPVLPVKFGTVAPDGGSVVRCLANGAAAFADAFQRMKGRTQFEILVTWDPEPVFAAIAANPKIVELKQQLTTGAGAPDPVAVARLGVLAKQFFDRRREEVSDAIAEVLRKTAEDAVTNALMDDRMVLNIALLIDDQKTAALDDCLETLDASYGGKLTFRCIGPLPSYSFAAVELSFLDADRIARARRLLELDVIQDAKTVQAAYRRLTKLVHPDTSGAVDVGGRIAELNDAFTTLSSYVDARGPVLIAVNRAEPAFAVGDG